MVAYVTYLLLSVASVRRVKEGQTNIHTITYCTFRIEVGLIQNSCFWVNAKNVIKELKTISQCDFNNLSLKMHTLKFKVRA